MITIHIEISKKRHMANHKIHKTPHFYSTPPLFFPTHPFILKNFEPPIKAVFSNLQPPFRNGGGGVRLCKAILYECWRSFKLEFLSISFAYSMSDVAGASRWLSNVFICRETKVLCFFCWQGTERLLEDSVKTRY